MTIDSLFTTAVEKKASDIHLVAGLKPIVRIDGVLHPLDQKGMSSSLIKELVFKMLTAEQKERLLKNKDIDLSYQVTDNGRFRVNIYFEKGNLGLVARIIPDKIKTMKELNLPEVVYDLLSREQGFILVTGPTGCGKSTTLAAMIEEINTHFKKNIITLEDPIEFLFKPNKSIIVQRELGFDIPSFASGLRHIVRQDPDIIMVGEMRDLETVAAAISLAETGHLVLATLHTYSAAQTIDRIIDIFPPYQQDQIRSQLSAVLTMVISQRLLPKENGGRVAAREMLINTPAVGNLIRENKIAQVDHVIETSAKEGMITMDKSLKNLYKDGLIAKELIDIYATDIEIKP
ncbi:MAG: type IV pilus twitching motility protein PilT [bacterium]|nr:type IV pilus twitching motility protein PilT [bacterium]